VESAVAHYRRELDASNAECDALRDAMGELQTDLHRTQQNYASLRKQNLGLQKRAVAREVCGEAGDPLAEQVRQQLETLVKEKARLAQENAALRWGGAS
jgi:chromosome segregation ATPase